MASDSTHDATLPADVKLPVKPERLQGIPRSRKRKRKAKTNPGHADMRPSLSPWLDLLSSLQFKSFEQKLHKEIIAYAQWVQPTPQESFTRQMAFLAVANAVGDYLPHAELKIQGSAAAGLCLPSSDLDFVLYTERNYTKDEERRVLRRLSYTLKGSGVAYDVRVVLWARVPIVIFTTPDDLGSFSVDICINNTDGFVALDRLKEYLAAMPALLPLTLVIKGFLAKRELNHAANGGLGSYAATLMVIHFLQVNPSDRAPELLQDPRNTESLGVLLSDFLFYYGVTFPYEESYISVTEGTLLPKSSAEWIDNRKRDGLSIQCLVYPDSDVGKSASRIQAVKAAFEEAYLGLLELSIEDNNLLGTIVGVTQQLIDKRARIAQIVDSQALQRIQSRLQFPDLQTPTSHNSYSAWRPPASPFNWQQNAGLTSLTHGYVPSLPGGHHNYDSGSPVDDRRYYEMHQPSHGNQSTQTHRYFGNTNYHTSGSSLSSQRRSSGRR